MSLISCHELGAIHENRRLYEKVSISIQQGDRVGLIGANGAGKTTLLRQLGGWLPIAEGTRAERKLLRKGYVPQTPVFDPTRNVRECVAAALAELPLLATETETDRDVRVAVMLDRLGFPDPDQTVQTLSGGWRKRLAIACALACEPEVLFLDEPTNHLDLEGILWLEDLLSRAEFAFVLITHDRFLLQSAANRVIELDSRYPGYTLDVNGDYASFLERRQNLLEQTAKAALTLENKVRNEIAYLRQGPKARSSKSGARVEKALAAIDDLAAHKARQTQDMGDVAFSSTQRRTRRLLAAGGVSKSLGGRLLLEGVDLLLSPQTRLGIVGENGSGKTTLLRLISGDLAPDTGEIRRAENLRVVYFDQGREQLDLSISLRKALAPKGDHVLYNGREQHVSGYARRFRFRPEQLDMPLSSLSGGEQAKVLIARLMLSPADILILDEPTNDLDIHSLEVLQEGLLRFPGAVVLVTHDRYLMDAVADSLLCLDGQGAVVQVADLAQWRTWIDARRRPKAPATPAKAGSERKRAERPRGLTYMEQKEYEGIEAVLLEAEARLADAERDLSDPTIAADAERLGAAYTASESARREVERLYARWAELEEKKAGSG